MVICLATTTEILSELANSIAEGPGANHALIHESSVSPPGGVLSTSGRPNYKRAGTCEKVALWRRIGFATIQGRCFSKLYKLGCRSPARHSNCSVLVPDSPRRSTSLAVNCLQSHYCVFWERCGFCHSDAIKSKVRDITFRRSILGKWGSAAPMLHNFEIASGEDTEPAVVFKFHDQP